MPLTGKELAKMAIKNGWVTVRVNGSHHQFKKEGIPYLVTIPIHGNKDIPKGLEKDLGL